MALDKNGLERLWSHIIARLGEKVDKEDGKGLSSCDFTQKEKDKLSMLETNMRADWNETDPDSESYIVNSPTESEQKLIVEWDGVVKDGMVSFSDDGRTYYKISDYSNTNIDDLSLVTINMNGAAQSVPVDDIAETATSPDGMTIIASPYFFIFPTSWASESVVVPEKGVYFLKSQYIYIEKLTGKTHVVKESAISSKIARLTDLPCGEMPGGIYWDGDITNKESIQVDSGVFAYKISEEIPDKESLVGKKIEFTSPDGYLEISIAPGHIVSFNEDLFTIIEYAVVVASKETTLEGVGTFSPGTYFMKTAQGNESAYISYLETGNFIKMLDEKFIPDTIARTKDIPTPVQSDWNTNDESDLSYVKNRTHYEVEKTIELLPNTVAAPGAPSAIADFTEDWNNDQFVALGNSRIYTTFDGKTYTYDSGLDYLETGGSSTTIMLGGNPYLFDNYLTDNGLPFFVGLMPIGKRFIAKWPQDDNEHTFSIKYGSGEYDVHQLDPKFIPTATDDEIIDLLISIDAFPALTDESGNIYTDEADNILLI